MSVTKIILDTNIVSYLMKGGLVTEAYAPHVQGKSVLRPFFWTHNAPHNWLTMERSGIASPS